MIQRIFIPLVICLLLISCTAGKKALERGEYYNATLLAVNRLRSNPNSEKALQAVKEGYPMAINYFQGRIDNALTANNPFRYSEVVGYYEKMDQLSDEVSRCPAALKVLPKVNYYSNELAHAKIVAAEEQYNAGLNNEKINTRLSWKDATLNYRQAAIFSPGYKDIDRRIEVAKQNATLKVVVEQIQVARKYQLTSDFFLNQVIESLSSNRPNEFVAYYSPESAEKAGITKPDQLLRMNFDEFAVGQVYDKESTSELSRDSVEVGTVTLPDGKKLKAYNTVKAKLTIYRRELISNGVLDVSIIDLVKNEVISQRKFPGQFVWFVEWGSYKGDERALNTDQLAICNSKPRSAPGPQDLFVEFTKPIFNQLGPFLRSFYQKY